MACLPYQHVEMVEVMCMQLVRDSTHFEHSEVRVSIAGRLVSLAAIRDDECPTSNGVDLIFSMTRTVVLEPVIFCVQKKKNKKKFLN